MYPAPTPLEPLPDASRRQTLGLGLGLLFAGTGLGGCGGGAGTGGTGDTVTGFSSGTISGFGSVIVNGVRYDDSRARVEDDSGALRSPADLRLGMTTEIDSDEVRLDGNGLRVASARSIRFASELLGPVSAGTLQGNSLVVLGQAVRLSVATVIDPRLVAAPGSVIEVYAHFDGTAFAATRLEATSGVADSYRIRGPVSALDTAARRFRIGSQLFSYEGASGVPANLANGQFVRAQLRTTPVGGLWLVTSLRGGQTSLADGAEAKLEGRITAFGSAASFSINGQAVDASGVSVPGLALGLRVEAEGPVRGGVLRATRLKIESEDEIRAEGVDLRGSIEAIDRSLRRFVLRGTTVSYAVGGIRYDDGSESDLAVGRQVEVRGLLSSDRSVVEASRIRFNR
jgi:hypothetical protein